MECQFNPKEYTITTTHTTQSAPSTAQQHAPPIHVQGSTSKTLSNLVLYFDTYNGEDAAMESVKSKYIDKLEQLVALDPDTVQIDTNAKQGRPPTVLFTWGRNVVFVGVINSCKVDYTLFNSLGTPVRAKATLQLTQAETNLGPQNPTSGGEGMRASRVVQPGDTLELIAYQEFGDPTMWRYLAAANGLENPRALKPGARLIVPNV